MTVSKDGIDRKAIKIRMIEQGISSNVELAEICGLSRNTVTNFFLGMTPTYSTIQALVKGLELPPDTAASIFFDF